MDTVGHLELKLYVINNYINYIIMSIIEYYILFIPIDEYRCPLIGMFGISECRFLYIYNNVIFNLNFIIIHLS